MTNGIPYFYVVSAYNTGGSSPTSDEAMAEPFVSPAAPTVTPNYGYSSDGMRAWKTVGGSTTYFLYDGSNPICELDGSGAVTATNTWGGSLLSRRVAAASTFYTFDPAGNIAQRLDASANVLDTYAFDAFGLRTGTDATPDPYAGFGGGWGYYTDAETGLSLLGHRYYDTGTGRFVTRDPIGYDGGINLYSYTGNNPVGRKDPSGYISTLDTPEAIDLQLTMLEEGEGDLIGLSEEKIEEAIANSLNKRGIVSAIGRNGERHVITQALKRCGPKPIRTLRNPQGLSFSDSAR